MSVSPGARSAFAPLALVALAFLVALSGCGGGSTTELSSDAETTEQADRTSGPGVTEKSLLNATLPDVCGQGKTRLANGEGGGKSSPYTGEPYSATVVETPGVWPAIGDVTGDGGDDGVIVVYEACGQAGNPLPRVHVLSDRNYLDELEIGKVFYEDITGNSSFQVKGVRIMGGDIVIDALGKPASAAQVEPFTETATIRWAWNGKSFIPHVQGGA